MKFFEIDARTDLATGIVWLGTQATQPQLSQSVCRQPKRRRVGKTPSHPSDPPSSPDAAATATPTGPALAPAKGSTPAPAKGAAETETASAAATSGQVIDFTLRLPVVTFIDGMGEVRGQPIKVSSQWKKDLACASVACASSLWNTYGPAASVAKFKESKRLLKEAQLENAAGGSEQQPDEPQIVKQAVISTKHLHA